MFMFGLRAIAFSGLIIATTYAASAGVTFPTQEGGERIVPRDKASAILTVFNCFQGGGGLGQGSFFADHGKVTFREGKLSVCSQSNYPVGFAYYTPDPGYVGDDTVQVYWGPYSVRVVIHVRDGAPQPATAPKKPHRH
jgi:hypothetical protein